MISARALGVYVKMLSNGAPMTAVELSKFFPEGRDAMYSVLSELREANLIETNTERINGRPITVSKFLTADSQLLEIRLLIQQSEQNSNLILDINSLNTNKRVFDEVKEGGSHEMEEWYEGGSQHFDSPEEAAEFRRQERQRRHDNKIKKETEDFEKRLEELKNLKPIDWTIDNAVYEFSRRMVRWDIRPWEGHKTRFRAAYAKQRSLHGTTGEEEIKIMDRFFSSLDHEKSGIRDPEVVWKLFIKRFPTLLKDIQTYEITDEDLESDKLEAKKQLEKF